MSDSIQALLQTRYDFAAVQVFPVARGMVNANLRIESPHGKFVLKRYRAGASGYPLAAIQRSCQFQATLAAGGVPVPRLVPNVAGEVVTVAEDGIYALSAFVEGRHHNRPGLPAQAAHAMGRALGAAHRVMAGVPVPLAPGIEGDPALSGVSFLAGSAHWQMPMPDTVIAKLERLLRLAEARRHDSRVDAAACEQLQGMITGISRLRLPSLPAEGLPAQWGHGDYQDTNVLFDAHDQVAAVLDFDNVRVRPRRLDLMRAMAYTFMEPARGLVPTAYDFFAGYLEEQDLPEEEVQGLAPLWTYSACTRSWPVDARYLEPAAYDPRWDSFIGPRTDWWELHHDQVTTELLRVRREVLRAGGLT